MELTFYSEFVFGGYLVTYTLPGVTHTHRPREVTYYFYPLPMGNYQGKSSSFLFENKKNRYISQTERPIEKISIFFAFQGIGHSGSIHMAYIFFKKSKK